MIKIRKGSERGYADHGWLKSYHSFSFADYYDPDYSGFRSLRVINEDRVSSGKGFGTHAHSNMEIISYVISGELAHKDSMGNGRTIYAGEVQAMSAGSGITHSEFNPSASQESHFLQIWIVPAEKNLKPAYAEWKSRGGNSGNNPELIGSADGRDGSVKINQDVSLYLVNIEPARKLSWPLDSKRHAWIQLIEGKMTVNGASIESGDGVAISEERELSIVADKNSKFLFFDLN